MLTSALLLGCCLASASSNHPEDLFFKNLSFFVFSKEVVAKLRKLCETVNTASTDPSPHPSCSTVVLPALSALDVLQSADLSLGKSEIGASFSRLLNPPLSFDQFLESLRLLVSLVPEAQPVLTALITQPTPWPAVAKAVADFRSPALAVDAAITSLTKTSWTQLRRRLDKFPTKFPGLQLLIELHACVRRAKFAAFVELVAAEISGFSGSSGAAKERTPVQQALTEIKATLDTLVRLKLQEISDEVKAAAAAAKMELEQLRKIFGTPSDDGDFQQVLTTLGQRASLGIHDVSN